MRNSKQPHFRGIWWMMAPLPLAVALLFGYLSAGLDAVIALPGSSLSWPLRDVLPIYLMQMPFAVAVLIMIYIRNRSWISVLVGFSISVLLNIGLYFIIGSLHP